MSVKKREREREREGGREEGDKDKIHFEEENLERKRKYFTWNQEIKQRSPEKESRDSISMSK